MKNHIQITCESCGDEILPEEYIIELRRSFICLSCYKKRWESAYPNDDPLTDKEALAELDASGLEYMKGYEYLMDEAEYAREMAETERREEKYL